MRLTRVSAAVLVGILDLSLRLSYHLLVRA